MQGIWKIDDNKCRNVSKLNQVASKSPDLAVSPEQFGSCFDSPSSHEACTAHNVGILKWHIT